MRIQCSGAGGPSESGNHCTAHRCHRLISPDEFRSSDHDPVLIGLFNDDDSDPNFDQGLPQSGDKFSFSTNDTSGCSCGQIIDALGLGRGHTRNGCSTSVMLQWIDRVNP